MNFRSILKGATAPLALSVALSANPVLAQDDSDPVVTTADEEAEAPPAAEGTIFVTGSRIRRDEFTAVAPLTVINPEIAARQGLISTGDMIQGSPIAAGSSQVTAALSSQFLVNGGQGVQTVSLRGLGAERTLVLLNGRRAGPAGTRGAVSAFDLNVLPFSIIQTIDVLKDGASSIYGSDAVAGVVNIITKRDTDGVEFDFFGSVPTHTGGEQWSAAATWGTTFDRGHVLASATYSRVNELSRGDRSYLQCAEANVFTDLSFSTRADLIDPRTGGFSCNGAESNNTWGHVWTYDYSYYYSPNGSNIPGSDGDGTAQLLQYSFPGDNLGQYLPAIGAAGPGQITVPAGWFNAGYDPASRSVYNNYHPGMNNDTIMPATDRYTAYIDAAYDLTSNVELYTELMFNKRKTYFDASGQVYQFGFGQTLDGLYGLDDAGNADPFANGFGGPALFSPTAFLDWYDSSQEVDYYRAVVGFRGDISERWSYDIYGQYSLSDASYSNQRVLQDSIDTQDFRSASCVGVVTPIGGKNCVDVDWYSPRVMYGQFNQAEMNFLTDTEVGNTKYRQYYVEGVVTGDLIDLEAGKVGVAFGGTVRRDSINDVPGAISQAGNAWLSGPAGVTQGYSTTVEGFGEINVPLLRDLPLIEALTISAAGRVTNVKSTRTADGVSDSDNGNITYKLQADWEIADFLRLRGTYGTSFRAPALFEQVLFDQIGAARQRDTDPCIQWGNARARGDISQQFADNCAADGVPANHTGSGIDASAITRGNLGTGIEPLKPETSTAWTASIIFRPEIPFLPNTQFNLSVDYFDIEVRGEIANFGVRNVVASCYASDNFPTDPLCDQFARVGDLDPSDPFWNSGNPNNIAFVRNNFVNINSQKNRGVDVTSRIEHDFAGDVSLTLQAQMTWQTKDEISVFAGFPESLNGEAGEPKWVGDFNAELVVGEWSLFYSLDAIGATSNNVDFVESETGQSYSDLTQTQIDAALCRQFVTYNDPVCFNLDIPAAFYHSFSINRQFADHFEVTAGVSNLFDKHPPRTSNVGGDGINQLGAGVLYSQYDLLGRRVFVNFKVNY